MSDEQTLTVAGDVATTEPESSEPARDPETGKFTSSGESEPEAPAAVEEPAQPSADEERELLEARVSTQKLYKDAAELGLLPLSDDLPMDQWQALRRMQTDGGIVNLTPETQQKLAKEGLSSPRSTTTESLEPEPDVAQKLFDTYSQRAKAYEAENPGFKDRVGALEFTEHLKPFIETAVIRSENGPRVADYLTQNKQALDRINALAPDEAIAEIARISERLIARDEYDMSRVQEHLSTIPQAVVNDFMDAAKDVKLTPEQMEMAMALQPIATRQLMDGLIANGRTDVAIKVWTDPVLFAKVNSMPPARMVAKLAALGADIDASHSWGDDDKESDRVKPTRDADREDIGKWMARGTIKPLSRPSPTDTGLRDDLPADEWVRRREAQIRQKARR